MDQLLSTAIDPLRECDENIFLTLIKLFTILYTIPVTVESSFSTLRWVKTLIRLNMQEDRLTSLRLLTVH